MEIFLNAFFETAQLLPILALVYFLIGFLEYKFGSHINQFMAHMGNLGPVVGALFGCIPQCGFSIVASALYVKRVISVGTLLSVFLSTSDEAVPILLSMPNRTGMVGLLIAIKIFVAIVAGVMVDYIIRRYNTHKQNQQNASDGACGCDIVNAHEGCCAHGVYGEQSKLKVLLLHPLKHTLKIFLFLLFLTMAFDYAIVRMGVQKISYVLMKGTLFQPVLASLIGLIPNCFASALLVELFDKTVISFGSMMAGLCAGTGLGLLVLIKENKDYKDTLRVIGLLMAVSIFVGVVIQFIGLPR